ncbi:unnamed protein product [Moneuplotes crassus]|uniref:Uncharacterized protein n=1 Tax=Euplotes crassus TaxID=5936 RepID=A0AAD1XU46_EUPCR|nr:unnamed protein product [Moneuplotes crassus]
MEVDLFQKNFLTYSTISCTISTQIGLDDSKVELSSLEPGSEPNTEKPNLRYRFINTEYKATNS